MRRCARSCEAPPAYLERRGFGGIASATRKTRSAPDGGDLGGRAELSYRVRQGDRGSQTNEISQPFKTRYGWHIVQMLALAPTTAPTMCAAKGLRRHPREQGDEETELWLRRLRDELCRSQDVGTLYLPRIVVTSGSRGDRTRRLRAVAQAIGRRSRRRGDASVLSAARLRSLPLRM